MKIRKRDFVEVMFDCLPDFFLDHGLLNQRSVRKNKLIGYTTARKTVGKYLKSKKCKSLQGEIFDF